MEKREGPRQMKRRLVILSLTLILVVAFGASCTSAAIERAKAQEHDAAAREKSAAIVAQVPVIEAETNAYLKTLQALEDSYKSRTLFDAQMGRNEFATIVLQFRALELSIQKEVEAARQATAELEKVAERADGVGHNAIAAADNSWVAAWALGIFGALLLGLTATLIVFCAKFERRLAALE